ncbi:MAG: polymer-forming cytoskeletal protein [Flavobacteriaceae bacterium]|nr:polymer-forming cytoskeletal protein [Flavobacteriaceae bacterium]
MFQKNKNPQVTVSDRNVVSKNTIFSGDFLSEGDFRIDGKIDGNITTSGKVVIGKEGIVNGNITCTNAEIEGLFTGILVVDELLSLKATSVINGEVTLGKLMVEPGAELNAVCTVKGTVKQMYHDESKTQKTA